MRFNSHVNNDYSQYIKIHHYVFKRIVTNNINIFDSYSLVNSMNCNL